MAKVTLVSLGCPKNLVDSECALGEIIEAGHELVVDKSCADVIIVNTCGFIESARAESVEAVLDALEYKQKGTCKAVVVVGCLSQRFGKGFASDVPELDAVLGVDHPSKLPGAIEQVLGGKRLIGDNAPPCEWVEQKARVISTPPWTAYLKLSDGCDNRCSYCAIPDIRGRYRSRPEDLVLAEAERLAEAGVKELILIGQDLTQYAMDRGEPNRLPGLLEKLNDIYGARWIRLMYCYPARITPELVDAVLGLEKVVKYMDIPLQHGDETVLRAMNRRGTIEGYLGVIDDLRARCPDIALRSSLIVGFPGETPDAFDKLLEFVRRIQFDRLGVFAYSREEGTPAASMKNQVSHKVSAARLDDVMKLQQGISLERNRRFVGRRIEVLIEGATEEGPLCGRSFRDAPDIDGLVYVKNCKAKAGDFVDVLITEAAEYDLVGTAR